MVSRFFLLPCAKLWFNSLVPLQIHFVIHSYIFRRDAPPWTSIVRSTQEGLSHTDFVHLFWPDSQSHLPILWQAGFIKIPFGYCGLSWDCPKVSWAQGKGISGRLYIREVSVHSIWDPEVCLFYSFNPATHPLIRSWQVSLSWNVSAGFATSAWDSAPFVSRQNAWIKTCASHSRVVRTGALRRGDRGRNSLLSHVLFAWHWCRKQDVSFFFFSL